MPKTFLFTDIEASTRLWEEHPEAMAKALELHDSILADAIAGLDGEVIKTTGDGFVAVFGSADLAVAASLRIQTGLNEAGWQETGPLRARVGVHTGDTDHRGGDHFGPTMNRTARIMSAGHGGQILLSGATAAAVRDRLPDQASLRDLGSHRLKDLTEPEQLFQLVHPGITTEFAELLTLDSRPNNLPRQATEFLGRAAELAAIEAMLESDATRLLTIAGPGGAGKTRLSLQVAAEEMTRFRDGAFFVDLTAERDPDSAFEAVVRTLDLPSAGGGDSLGVLKTRLRDRNMLLVLDNFEQVMSAAAGVGELVQHCPELKIVVTSRETLRVRAERVFPVPPMSLPDPRAPVSLIAESEAVQLFTERAAAVRPDFTLDEDTGRVVAEICLRLDGLPLAMELAAARLNLFTPAELLARLKDRLDILGAGGRDLPDRQRTLWGAIGWSYELLDEDERALLEVMSVFSPTRLEALESVAQPLLGTGTVVEPLASLVDKSLVRRETVGDTTRFSLLLMIREYAAERLAASPDREQAARQGHAVHFSAMVVVLHERLKSDGRDSALGDLEHEIGNLRTAWRHWVEMGDVEQLFGLLDGLWALHEAKGWYHAAIELARDTLGVLANAEPSSQLAGEELIIRTSLARALMAIKGYDDEVEEAFKEALAVSGASADASHRSPVLRALASYYILSGDLKGAVSIGQELVQLGEQTGDDAILAEGHCVIGAAIGFGEPATSLPHLEEAIRLYDVTRHGPSRFRVGPDTGIVARVASALTLWLAGDPAKATARMDDALAQALDLGHPFSEAYALYHSAYLTVARGRFEECLTRSEELRAVASENEYAIWETLATVLEGVALTGLGSLEEGVAKTEAGIRLYQGLTTPPVFWPLLLTLRSMVHALAGLPERAMELIDEAIVTGTSDFGLMPGLLLQRADILQMLPDPDPDEVERHYLDEIEIARAAKLRFIELQATTRLVAWRRERGITPDGTDQLATVCATFDEDLDEPAIEASRRLLEST